MKPFNLVIPAGPPIAERTDGGDRLTKLAARGTKTAAALREGSAGTVPLSELACHCSTRRPCATCLRWLGLATRLVIRRAAWGAT